MLRLGSLLALGLLCAAAPASAQTIRLDQYRMAQTPVDGFSLSRPNAHGHLSFGVRLDVDYALNPLVYQLRASDSGTEVSPIVEHLLAAQLGVSFSLFDRLVIYAGLPVNLVMDGTVVDGQPRADGASLGDVGFGVRGRLFGEDDEAFALSLQASGTAPTAQAARAQSRFAGEGNWTFHPEVLLEVRIGDVVRVGGNVGARLREEQDFGRLRVGHELTWSGAVTVAVVPDVFELSVESWGSSALDSRFGDAQLSPIELVGGLRVLPVDGLSVGAAAGGGVARGYGAGDFRAVLSVGYASPGEDPASDRDEDGLGDEDDECPDEPEDLDSFEDDDGCPDPDNDGDGVLDASDDCPDRAEDMDGLGDEDGCPEEDFDEDGVLDEADRCPTEPGDALASRPECSGCPNCEGDPPQPEWEAEAEPELDAEAEPEWEAEAEPAREPPPEPEPEPEPEWEPAPERAPVARRARERGPEPRRSRVRGRAPGRRRPPVDQWEPVPAPPSTLEPRVHFATGLYDLRDGEQPALRALLEHVQARPGTQYIVEGHADFRGPLSENLQLSLRRAGQVVDWLTARGIERRRVIGIGCGERYPAYGVFGRAGLDASRRVELRPLEGVAARPGCRRLEP